MRQVIHGQLTTTKKQFLGILPSGSLWKFAKRNCRAWQAAKNKNKEVEAEQENVEKKKEKWIQNSWRKKNISGSFGRLECENKEVHLFPTDFIVWIKNAILHFMFRYCNEIIFRGEPTNRNIYELIDENYRGVSSEITRDSKCNFCTLLFHPRFMHLHFHSCIYTAACLSNNYIYNSRMTMSSTNHAWGTTSPDNASLKTTNTTNVQLRKFVFPSKALSRLDTAAYVWAGELCSRAAESPRNIQYLSKRIFSKKCFTEVWGFFKKFLLNFINFIEATMINIFDKALEVIYVENYVETDSNYFSFRWIKVWEFFHHFKAWSTVK